MFKVYSFSKIIFIVFFLSCQSILPQIRFRELPENKIDVQQLFYYENSESREIILLNGEWSVYSADDAEKRKTNISIPSVYEGDYSLVFEKSFDLPKGVLKEKQFQLNFLGISYAADISLNGNIIHRHVGGAYPLTLSLPKDLLKDGAPNTIGVKVSPKLDAMNTIPVKMRLLEPQRLGGIFRDVFITTVSNVFINELQYTYKLKPASRSADFNFKCLIANSDFSTQPDSSRQKNNFELKVVIKKVGPGDQAYIASFKSEILPGKQRNVDLNMTLDNLELWSPNSPVVYQLILKLMAGDQLIDETIKNISFYSLQPGQNNLLFNGYKFQLNGVTYVPSNGVFGDYIGYDQMTKDIKAIKDLGFNSIRFEKVIPHPYYLYLCERLGLLAFLDLPLGGIPEHFIENKAFIENSKNFLIAYLKGYRNYSAVAGLNIGYSYIGNYQAHRFLINELVTSIKRDFKKVITASYQNFEIEEIEGVDLLGIEILNTNISELSGKINLLTQKFGKGKIFFSSAGYLANVEHSAPYSPHTPEAQARFYDDFLNFVLGSDIAGFYISTMFDYRAGYSSIVSGYNQEHIIHLGILGEDRSTNRLSYKVIDSKLHNKEKVTLSLGFKRDDSPMIFTIAGLLLALTFLSLFKSGRKFREDCMRALRYPYNFYQDIRDVRIISGIQTVGLGVIISTVLALIASSLLFDLKNYIVFERVVLAFGSETLVKIVSFLAWNPGYSILYLTIFFLVGSGVISLIIRFFSFFVINRVPVSNCYYVTIWSFLPYILLIPVTIVLYRILNADLVTPYIYSALFLFVFWTLYRLLKGVYVIFDSTPLKVYLVGFIFIATVFSIILVSFQASESTIDYLYQAYVDFRNL